MTKRKRLKQVAFRFDAEMIADLEELRRQIGVPVSESVRRAVRSWLTEQGIGLQAKITIADARLGPAPTSDAMPTRPRSDRPKRERR